jgi:GntR family transcriptional regulator
MSASAATRRSRPTSATGAIASPRYHQVYVTVRAWVHDGSYRAGEQLPTEPELCRIFGVSRITIRKAIAALEAEGWLERKQGRGTFACVPAGDRALPLDLHAVVGQVSDLAARTTVRGFVSTEVLPDEDTRSALRLQAGERVRRAVHVRELDGAPLGLITTFVPLDIAARLTDANEREQPMFVAQALDVEVGAPLLRLVRVVKDDSGRPVERVVALYRADRYQYHLHLEVRPTARRP